MSLLHLRFKNPINFQFISFFQFEQKKFLQQHKIRADSYSKAAATMKKQRKKKATSQNADKEIKVDNSIYFARIVDNKTFSLLNLDSSIEWVLKIFQNLFFFYSQSIQAMDEEKNKLDTFCEQSLKNVSKFYLSSLWKVGKASRQKQFVWVDIGNFLFLLIFNVEDLIKLRRKREKL